MPNVNFNQSAGFLCIMTPQICQCP